jgi:hypothetical protein
MAGITRLSANLGVVSMRRRQSFQLAGATLVVACGVLPVTHITVQMTIDLAVRLVRQ